MIVKWEVNVNSNGEYETEIDDNELKGLKEKDRDKYIEDQIQHDFEQQVYFVRGIASE